MRLPPENPTFQEFRHARWIEGARALADRPSAIDAGLTFDDAYAAVAQMEVRYGNAALVPTGLIETNPPVSELTATDFFDMTEAIDVMLDHGDKKQRISAATFVAELMDIMPMAKEPDTKRSMLMSVLGIEIPSDVPVSQQIVEKRLLQAGTAEEQIALAGLIESCKHTYASAI